MQLNEEECKQLGRIVGLILREAVYDYSYSWDMSVVNINGQPLIFDKEQISLLRNFMQNFGTNN